MAAVIASINPFPSDVRTAYEAYIRSPQYSNRERIEYSKWHQLYFFLQNPTSKPATSTESSLKHRALTKFELINNKLYRQADTKFLARYVIQESEAFDCIINEHLQADNGKEFKGVFRCLPAEF
jgi:hypothetical protein